MQHEIVNRKLIFHLEGELNSYNAENVENEIEEVKSKGGFDTIVWDIENLRYMSSAGLRIVARLKQMYDDFSIINMSNDIYEVFEMVGFNDLIKVTRKK